MLDDILTSIRTIGMFGLLYFCPGIILAALVLGGAGEGTVEPETQGFTVCNGELIEFENVQSEGSWAEGMLRSADFNGSPVLLYFTGNPPNYDKTLVEIRVDDVVGDDRLTGGSTIYDCNK